MIPYADEYKEVEIAQAGAIIAVTGLKVNNYIFF